MAFEAFAVAVKLSLVSNVTQGLLGISRNLQAANMDAHKLQSSLKSIGRQLAVGGIMVAGGVAIGNMLKTPLEHAQKFQNEMAKFQALGLGDNVNQRAANFAKHMNVIGISSIETAKLLRESTSIMNDFGHAQEALPFIAKMKFGLSAVMGDGQGEKFENMFQAAIKVTELRGALINKTTGQVDLAKFQSALNQMTQAYVASGGTVTPNDYLQAIKTGGVSTKLMNDEMFYFGLGHFMQESGGSRTGTASMSMFQNWAMGRMSQQVAEKMQSFGLLEKNKLHYGKTGHITKVDPMGILKAKEFTDNPFKWVTDVAVPMLKKKGLKGNDINIGLAQILGIRTASNLADQFVRDGKLADGYIKRAKKAFGVDQLYQEGAKTLSGEEMIFNAQWSNLMTNLGTVILPMANKALEKFNPMLAKAAEWADKNQEKIGFLVTGLVGLSGILIGGGLINIVAASARGFALLYTALGGVSGFMGRKLGFIGTATKAIAKWMLWPFSYVGSKIGNVIGRLGEFIIGKFDGVLSFVGAKVFPLIRTAFMFLFRAIPVVGWVIGLVALGIYLYRNWDKVVAKAKALWTQYGHYITDGWNWLKSETMKIWGPIQKYVSDIWDGITSGIKTALNFVWDQFAWLFDKIGVGYKNGLVAAIPGFTSYSDAMTPRFPGMYSSASVPVPPKQPITVQTTTTLHLDGKQIATTVTREQAKAASRPQSGTSQYDISMGYPSPGMNSSIYLGGNR